jgi:hypothetical protein
MKRDLRFFMCALLTRHRRQNRAPCPRRHHPHSDPLTTPWRRRGARGIQLAHGDLITTALRADQPHCRPDVLGLGRRRSAGRDVVASLPSELDLCWLLALSVPMRRLRRPIRPDAEIYNVKPFLGMKKLHEETRDATKRRERLGWGRYRSRSLRQFAYWARRVRLSGWSGFMGIEIIQGLLKREGEQLQLLMPLLV